MRFNFRKVSAVLASGLMAVSGIGFAAAASYPAPFVQGSSADVAIVYGTGEGASALDAVEAGYISTNLQSYMGGSSGDVDDSVVGEAVELYSGGTKIYVNDSLNTVKTVLTKAALPTVLEDGSFQGNVDASYTQSINLGSNPKVQFKEQPTSSDDVAYGLALSSTQANYIYNSTVTFNKAVNFSHADSEGSSISLFGQDFTVSADTSATDLVLLKAAEKFILTNTEPSKDVIIDDETYTVDLVSSSDTSATIKVTDSSGDSDTKEVTEADSKKIQGISIAVITADETNLQLTATILAGSSDTKLTLTDGSSVTMGESATVIDGTIVDFGTGNPGALTTLAVSVYAADSDNDALLPGGSFTDPVYGSFKLDFPGLNIASDSTSAREDIVFATNGDEKMDVTFTNFDGDSATITFANNESGTLELQDESYYNISVREMETIFKGDYVVIGNEDEGRMLKLSQLRNQTTGFSSDKATFTDQFSGDTIETVWTNEGTGTLTVGGIEYAVEMDFTSSAVSSEAANLTLNYPDSSTAAGDIILYPTIQTMHGAKAMFYEPVTLNLGNWDEADNELATIRIPDGNGYTDTAVVKETGTSNWNVSATTLTTNATAGSESVLLTIGQLRFNVTNSGVNQTTVYLQTVAGNVNILTPAMVFFEEEDDNNQYQAMIVELENGATGDDGVGIDSVEDTWSDDASAWSATLSSDSDKVLRGDLYGMIAAIDSSDSDQKTAILSYPDDQVYAKLYMAELDASIAAGQVTSGTNQPLGEIVYEDSETSMFSNKNVIVVGGSCINSAAASLLGSAYCGESFTEATDVSAGQFLIQGFDGGFASGKLALLVAGYNVEDTVNAGKYLRSNLPDTSSKWIGTSSTSAELQVE